MTTTIEIAESGRYDLAEGPVRLDSHRVAFVDILRGAVHQLDLSDGASRRTHCLDEPVGAIAPAPRGLVAACGRRFMLLTDDGASIPLTPEVSTDSDQRMNDGKVDPFGSFCAGTTSYRGLEGAASLYRLTPGGTAELALSHLSNSNGLAWSADGSSMFHIDTPRRAVAQWAYGPDGPHGDGPRRVIDLSSHSGWPDGMSIDDEGNLWIAMFGASNVICITPQGRTVRTLTLPATQPTCTTFAGADGSTLVVTSARHGLTSPRPEDGAVFVTDIDATGPAPDTFTVPRSES